MILLDKKIFLLFFKYGIVGALAFTVDFLVLVFLKEVVNFDIVFAATISYISGVAVHFNLNRYWNFRNFQRTYKGQLKTYLFATIIFYLVNITTLQLFISLGMHYTLSKIMATGALAIFTFLFNKNITFNKYSLKDFLAKIYKKGDY